MFTGFAPRPFKIIKIFVNILFESLNQICTSVLHTQSQGAAIFPQKTTKIVCLGFFILLRRICCWQLARELLRQLLRQQPPGAALFLLVPVPDSEVTMVGVCCITSVMLWNSGAMDSSFCTCTTGSPPPKQTNNTLLEGPILLPQARAAILIPPTSGKPFHFCTFT